jgi:hypothetical protein
MVFAFAAERRQLFLPPDRLVLFLKYQQRPLNDGFMAKTMLLVLQTVILTQSP